MSPTEEAPATPAAATPDAKPAVSGAYRPPAHGVDEDDPAYLRTMCLAALGVVFGDIGTSPLYAMKECFNPAGSHHVAITEPAVLGVLSLIFWSLVVVIAIKYLCYVTYADFNGEGGILALMALVIQGRDPTKSAFFIALGLFGAALLFGDGTITPAISVLSAVEGLNVATDRFENVVIPITLSIIFILFAFQHKGTARVGKLFGPVTVTWFLSLGVLGLINIQQAPGVLTALDPRHALGFLYDHQMHGFLMLGAVFLVVTGGEALYADMGHFGRKPIMITWFMVVMPCLLLNYFGQGALILSHPETADNPFFKMVPTVALYPMVILSTLATIIASQAMISGVFSITRQAVMLGYWPRVRIMHTSPDEIGQVYIPEINWALMVVTMFVVLFFKSSGNLAAAYGIAVSLTMMITTLMAHFAAQRLWGWPWWKSFAVSTVFVFFDLGFFGANMTKIAQGGWFPLVMAVGLYTLMVTWRRGREILWERIREKVVPWEKFLADLEKAPPYRVPGTAVFMTGAAGGAPAALLHNLEHNRVLHQNVIMVMVSFEEVPRVPEADRIEVTPMAQGFFKARIRYGFTENADVPRDLARLREHGVDLDLERMTYFLGRETLIPSPRPGMALWREQVFAFMSRNALQATNFFNIPPDRVMEIGIQIEM